MECALCKSKPADKKNTHYLTDSIIRTCLNLDGQNVRETGYYFDLSGTSIYSKFNFQRETSVERLTAAFGRPPTDEEIDNAKTIPFSVDYVFCSDCEKKFTKIETYFSTSILPLFREKDLTGLTELQFQNSLLIRLFFLIQVWRTHVCVEHFKIPNAIAENLRLKILNADTLDEKDLSMYPMAITYLQTIGCPKEYTSNFIVIPDDIKPNRIVFNDFCIQFFSTEAEICFELFHGLNEESTFLDLLNVNSESFKIKIVKNENRKIFFKEIITHEKIKSGLADLRENFIRVWRYFFGFIPPMVLIYEYQYYITHQGDFNILQYSEQQIADMTAKFISTKVIR